VLPRIVAIRASFKSLLIESEAQQFSALLIQGGNGANFPDVEIERKQPMAKCCGERSRAARSQPPRSDQTQGPTKRFCSSKLSDRAEFSVPVFAGVVVIATGEFDEHARLIAHRPRIVTRWQQHHIVL
jgi:hypothetical protein